MGNIQPVGGRKPLQDMPGFQEHFAEKRRQLVEKCKQVVVTGETGITISYNDLLVYNPNRDLYDDYLIDQKEIRKILNEVVHQPYTVENQVVKSGEVIFYAMSSLKILFVYGIQQVPHLPASPPCELQAQATKKPEHAKQPQTQNDLVELSEQDINIIPGEDTII
jgi:hypothetical protein